MAFLNQSRVLRSAACAVVKGRRYSRSNSGNQNNARCRNVQKSARLNGTVG